MAKFSEKEVRDFYETLKVFDLKINTRGNERQKECLAFLFSTDPKDLEVTEVGFGGAAGGSKTFTYIMWQFILRISCPNTASFWGRTSIKKVVSTTYKSYKKFLRIYQVPKILQGKYDKQENTIFFPNGSTIEFIALETGGEQDEEYGLGGKEYTDGLIEESQEIAYEVIEAIHKRVGRMENDTYNLPGRIGESFNPDKGHIYKRFWLPSEFKNNDMPKYRRFFRALATDNKYNTPGYLENLLKGTKSRVQRLYYGNFDYAETKGELFNYYKLLELRHNKKIPGAKNIVCDPAREGGDFITISVWNGNTMIGWKKYDYQKVTYTQDQLTKISQMASVPMDRVLVDGNGLGAAIADNIKCKMFINNKPPIDTREEWEVKMNVGEVPNYGMLKDQAYFMLAEMIEEGKLCIPSSVMPDDDFDKLVEELENTTEDMTKDDSKRRIIQKKEIKKKIGRSPDSADNLAMEMFFYLEKTIKKRRAVTLKG